MKVISLQQINYMHFLVCFLATIGLSIYSLLRYISNDDSTSIEIKRFLSSDDAIYPSFSFCIMSPFLDDKFEVYGDEEINKTTYVEFLKGEFWNDRMLKIHYDDVTVSLNGSLIESMYRDHSNNPFRFNPDHYVSFRSSERKCFTLTAPFPNKDLLWEFAYRIGNNIFPTGKRAQPNQIYTYLHYPWQRFTAYYTIKRDLPPRMDYGKAYYMEFTVRNIDVITRRNKLKNPCIEDWKHYDKYIMENKMQLVGCRPPHWESTSNLSLCSNKSQMKHFAEQPTTIEVESFPPPCKAIDRLDYTFGEFDTLG